MFMEQGISSSERVLVICTETYFDKAQGGHGGVGYEKLLVGADLIHNLGTDKFIPILRSRRQPPPIPSFLGTRLYIDFNDDSAFDAQMEVLLRELHRTPL